MKQTIIKYPELQDQHVVCMEPPYGRCVRYAIVPIIGFGDAVEKMNCARNLVCYVNQTNAPTQ